MFLNHKQQWQQQGSVTAQLRTLQVELQNIDSNISYNTN
jgi:hypothetical protein